MNTNITLKLFLSIAFSLLWLLFSLWLGQWWIQDLANDFGAVGAYVIFTGIAGIPGTATAFILASIFFRSTENYDFSVGQPRVPVTIIVAAFNEESRIYKTLLSIKRQNYYGGIRTIVVDDGSEDSTTQKVRRFIYNYPNMDVRLVQQEQNQGKASALNKALEQVDTEIIITLDADSILEPSAVTALVSQLVNSSENVRSAAGTILVKNYKTSMLTKMQQWDYFFGIGIVKKAQSLYNGTLVAQGAFSAYYSETVREIGGWPELIGEDIVLTWAFRRHGYDVSYTDTALCFTDTPTNFRGFFSQRSRWAMGLIQAFRTHPSTIWKLKHNTPFVWYNLTFPFVDFMYLCVFVPGVIMALFFGYYAIAGLYTIALIPLGLVVMIMHFKSQTGSLGRVGIEPGKNAKNWLGFVMFFLFYQAILSYSSLMGYLQYFFKNDRKWSIK